MAADYRELLRRQQSGRAPRYVMHLGVRALHTHPNCLLPLRTAGLMLLRISSPSGSTGRDLGHSALSAAQEHLAPEASSAPLTGPQPPIGTAAGRDRYHTHA